MTYEERTDLLRAAGPTYDDRRAAEAEVESAKVEKCKRVCREVARALGDPWRAEDKVDGDGRYWRTRLVGNEELHESLFVSLSPYHARGRLIFSGDFPSDRHGSFRPYREAFEITVNEDRPAEEIAKELKRRLLPKYLAAVAKATGEMIDRQGKEAQRLYRYKELIKALGAGEIINADRDRPEVRVYRKGDDEAFALSHLEASTYGGDSSFELKLTANYELTLAIAKLVRKFDAEAK